MSILTLPIHLYFVLRFKHCPTCDYYTCILLRGFKLQRQKFNFERHYMPYRKIELRVIKVSANIYSHTYKPLYIV